MKEIIDDMDNLVDIQEIVDAFNLLKQKRINISWFLNVKKEFVKLRYNLTDEQYELLERRLR
jgi:hypothetical protein